MCILFQILNVCATLLIVQFLFGFTVIVSFVIRVDKRIDILKNDGNNDDYALEYFQNKACYCFYSGAFVPDT